MYHRSFRDLHFLDVLPRRQVEHHVGEKFLDNRAEHASAGAALERLLGDGPKRTLVEAELHFLELEQLRILLRERVLRLLEDANERVFVQGLERNDNREAADELRDQTIAKQIVRFDLGERILLFLPRLAGVGAGESDLSPAGSRFDNLLEAIEGTAADEQDVLGVDLDILLLRMLPAPLRRYRGDGALENLEQRLLHTFTGDIPRYAGILRLARDFVDLIDVNDAALAFSNVEITRLEQADENVFDILTDVTSFGEGRGVSDREGDVEDARKRLGEQRLPDTRRTDEENVRLVQFDIVIPHRRRIDAFVVIVDCDRQRFLRSLLTDHVLVQNVFDLLRRRDLCNGFGNLSLLVLRENLVAQSNALVADVDRRAGDEFPDRVFRLSAERAAQMFVVRHNESLQRTRRGGSRLGRSGDVRGARE